MVEMDKSGIENGYLAASDGVGLFVQLCVSLEGLLYIAVMNGLDDCGSLADSLTYLLNNK